MPGQSLQRRLLARLELGPRAPSHRLVHGAGIHAVGLGVGKAFPRFADTHVRAASGYDAHEASAPTVQLVRGVPAHADHMIRANRSVTGRVEATDAAVTVRLLETGTVQHADGDGYFVFRNLQPGSYTVVLETGGHRTRRRVVVPDGPAIVRVDVLEYPEGW